MRRRRSMLGRILGALGGGRAAPERREYEAARRGRGTEGWIAAGTSADAEIAAAGPALRERMRDLVRNDALAANAVQVLVSNIVGAGIRARAAGPDAEENRRADEVWRRWAARADADGHTDFHGLTALAVREMIEGGEVIARRIRRRTSDGLPVPLQVQILEADHLDDGKNEELPDGGRIVSGIEYDAQGRRRAYWLYRDHPGDRTAWVGRSMESQRVPAEDVAHLFERQRVQNRGVPWGVPAITGLRELGDWRTAELTRKKIEASTVAFVFADEEGESIAPVVIDSDGNRVEQFEPGLISYVRHGKDVKFNNPASTSGIYEWNRVQQHTIAAGFRVPYALLTGDLSQVNFSSSRVGLNEFRRMVEAVQWHTVIPMFCERIWGWVMDAAFTAGLVPRPDIPAEWGPPRFESVNPLQDVQADILEVRAGFATPQQMIAKRGYDPDAVLGEWAQAAEMMDAAGLVFDSDPRRTTKGGSEQPSETAAASGPSESGDQ